MKPPVIPVGMPEFSHKDVELRTDEHLESNTRVPCKLTIHGLDFGIPAEMTGL